MIWRLGFINNHWVSFSFCSHFKPSIYIILSLTIKGNINQGCFSSLHLSLEMTFIKKIFKNILYLSSTVDLLLLFLQRFLIPTEQLTVDSLFLPHSLLHPLRVYNNNPIHRYTVTTRAGAQTQSKQAGTRLSSSHSWMSRNAMEMER